MEFLLPSCLVPAHVQNQQTLELVHVYTCRILMGALSNMPAAIFVFRTTQ